MKVTKNGGRRKGVVILLNKKVIHYAQNTAYLWEIPGILCRKFTHKKLVIKLYFFMSGSIKLLENFQ